LNDVAAGRGLSGEFGEGGVLALLFSLVVSALTGLVDGYLAHTLPIPLRVPLTAIVGATMAVGLILALAGKMLSQPILLPFAIGGALCMAVCSFLSNDYDS
jgi:hypothetical protein